MEEDSLSCLDNLLVRPYQTNFESGKCSDHETKISTFGK